MIPSTTPFFSRVYADSPAKLSFLSEAYTLFNFGQADYKLINRSGVLELQKKWGMQPGFASTLVKIIIIATVIIPLLALIAIAFYRSANQLKLQKISMQEDTQIILELVAPYLNIKDLSTSRAASTAWRQAGQSAFIKRLNSNEVTLNALKCDIDDLRNTLGENCPKITTLNVNKVSDSWLSKIPEFFPNLKHLFLNYVSITENSIPILSQMKALETLRLSFCDFQDFSFLKDLPKLQNLDLSCNYKFSKLDFISECASLKHLNLVGCYKVGDFNPLNRLALTTLNLSCCEQIENLNFLANMSSLEHFHLSNCAKIKEISPLQNLLALKTLNLYGCSKINNLDFIKKLNKLEKLDISRCFQILNFDFLNHMPSIIDLDLEGCKLVNIKFLQNCPSLTYLNLASCREGKDLTLLQHCPRMKKLVLSTLAPGCNLHALGQLSNIEELDLRICTEKNIGFLSNLRLLKKISFQDHVFTDITPLSNCTLLESLSLRSCRKLQSLNGIQNLPIQNLEIKYCPNITDFSAVLSCPQLKSFLYEGRIQAIKR